MSVNLSAETQKLIEQRIQRGGYPTADELVRAALATLESVEADVLDDDTLASIDRAEAEHNRGEGLPVDVVFAQLRQKHFG